MLLLTGALTSKPYAFTSRPWELRSANSIDGLDGVGSNIRIDFKEAEIVRILPSRQPDINESWISDKIRFFYDGLKQQRLHLPYVKEFGALKKTKWDQTLSKFSSLLKVYAYEYGASKIGILSGPNLDLEAFYATRDFCSNFGFSFLGMEKDAKISIDSPSSYKFQNQIKDLEKADFCLLVGTNPRFEASTLNLRLRKIFRRGTLEIASIGGCFDPTYPVKASGLSSKTLLALAEGKHSFCKSLSKAKNPVIIFGDKLYNRHDSFALTNLFKSIALFFPKVFGKKISINSLSTDSNVVGGLELGISCLNKSILKDMKVLYGIGLENSSILSEFLKTPSVFALQTSHGNERIQKADFLFPATVFTEKAGIYYNLEGRPQKTQKSVSGPNLSKDDWQILTVLFSYLNRSVQYSTKSHLRHKISKLLPSSSFPNTWFSKNEGNLSSSYFFGKIRSGRLLKSPFKLAVEDFFMSNSLCQSSRVMAKASEYLRSASTNYKFLTYCSLSK